MIFSKQEISKILIKQDSTLRHAISIMNKTGLKILIIVKKNSKILGTLVDGDIRRGLIKGLNLESKILSIINTKPKVIKKQISTVEANEIMRLNYLNHLPIIDSKNRPVALHTIDDSLKTLKRSNKFIIMAGGRGKRLLPYTIKTPKPLVKVFGKPMLEHIILKARNNGFMNFSLSVNYLKSKIKKYFLDGKRLNVKINYLEESKPLGTAGSLHLLRKIKNQNIIVSNCDVITDLDYGDLLDYHVLNKSDATMVVRRFEKKNQFGVIRASGKNFLSYEEKPLTLENINAGIYVLNSRILKFLKPNSKIDMTEFFLKLKKKKRNVIIYPIYENWTDVGQRKTKK